MSKSPWQLLRWAIDEIVAPTPPSFGPLCVVTPTAAAALLDDVASRADHAGKAVIRRSGLALGDEITVAVANDSQDRLQERMTAADLIVVDSFEAIGDGDRQAVACQLFDATVATGAVWCLSLARLPHSAGLDPCLVSRLVGGLVVSLPSRVSGPPRPPPKISTIIAATARQFDLSVAEMIGLRRSRHVAGARSLAMYLARELTGASFHVIGKACGGRDHTTAMHATRKVAAEINRDASLTADADAIKARVG